MPHEAIRSLTIEVSVDTALKCASPVERSFQATGARICWFEWGNPSSPPLLLIHATGFHARVWDQTIAALPGDHHVIAVDLRGHGRSEKTGPLTDWSLVAHDVSELVAHLGLRNAIGVGHSMGGHCLVQVAAKHPECFSRLILIDPVILPPDAYESGMPATLPAPETNPVSRRRNVWASWQEMETHFSTRYPYSVWKKEVLADYCRYGLLPNAQGDGFMLACPPVIEASVYLGHAYTNVHPLIKKIHVPVLVMRAKDKNPDAGSVMDFSASPTWKDLAFTFPEGRDLHFPDLTHFIPMQAPELVARHISDPHIPDNG